MNIVGRGYVQDFEGTRHLQEVCFLIRLDRGTMTRVPEAAFHAALDAMKREEPIAITETETGEWRTRSVTSQEMVLWGIVSMWRDSPYQWANKKGWGTLEEAHLTDEPVVSKWSGHATMRVRVTPGGTRIPVDNVPWGDPK